MPERLSEQDSMALYFVKVIAILACIWGHVVPIDTSTPLLGLVTRTLDMSSCICVTNFMIVGGILYNRTPGDSKAFWKKKAKTIILPWLFCGVLTYAYRSIFIGGSFPEMIRWVLGISSWLYYVTVYLILQAFFKPIHKSVPALWACVAATAIQLIFKSMGRGLPSPWGCDYSNPLHWVGFFALGILLRRQKLQFSKWVFICSATAFLVSGVICYHKYIYDYFHILNSVFTISAFFLLLYLGRRLADTRLRDWIREIGTSTYCIYLLHLLIIPPILRRIPGDTFKAFFAPYIGLAIMMLLIRIGKYITGKLPFGDKIRALVGLR